MKAALWDARDELERLKDRLMARRPPSPRLLDPLGPPVMPSPLDRLCDAVLAAPWPGEALMSHSLRPGWEGGPAAKPLKPEDRLPPGCTRVVADPMRPRIVCLCGSTRFKQQFIEANFRETMAGRIVLSVGWFGHADGHIYTPTATEKIALDQLHLQKIDLADEVLVIDGDGGYIGDSTRNEIAHAERTGKLVRYLSAEDGTHAARLAAEQGVIREAAAPLPVSVACTHTGGRCVYRPAHGMEICKDCGLTVPAREA